MGTFMGHLIPGAFFMSMAIWWIIQLFRRYFQSLLPNSAPFRSTLTFPPSCLCGRCRTWELEGFTKIVMCIVGITGEIITAFHDGHFEYLGNGQHATMFFFFGMSGVVDILIHCRLPLPHGTEYFMIMLAVTVEAILFKFHLDGRSTLDVTLHTLLLYCIYAALVAFAVELKFRQQPLVALFRAFCVLVQGSWFIHVGYILYNPQTDAVLWDGEDRDKILLCTMMFAWHMAGAFFFMMIMGLIIGCRYRCRGKFNVSSYDPLQMKLLKTDANGQTIVNLNDDDLSESDTEFERIVNGRR